MVARWLVLPPQRNKVVGLIPALGHFCVEFVCSHHICMDSLASFHSPKHEHEVI